MNVIWREQAAKDFLIPKLCKLVGRPPTHKRVSAEAITARNSLRNLAIKLLCKMATTPTIDTRLQLIEYEVINIFLQLLNEEEWQQLVLDALASWLESDVHQIEAKLLMTDTVQSLINILNSYHLRGTQIADVLDPLLRMLLRSDKLTRSLSQSGMTKVVVNLLIGSDATTCLKLLNTLTRLYNMHPRPKEFINTYGVERHLKVLVASEENERPLLARKQAAELLKAFQINQIW